MQQAVGRYVGNAAAGRRIVTGLSGAISRVRLIQDLGAASQPLLKTAAMLAPESAVEASGPNSAGAILFSGADFVVTDLALDSANTLAMVYDWEAWSE